MTDVDILIIGAGLAGIGTAARLRHDHPGKTIAILEARANIGGTWDLFRYPGIRSDTDPFTMGYGFRPWSGTTGVASGESLREYIGRTAAATGIDREIRFGTKATAATWSSTEARWTVQATASDATERGTSEERERAVSTEYRCRFLYLCTGYYDYDRGHQPDFAGVESFAGTLVWPQFWPADLDYAGQKVVVIGSGATAVTLVPELAKTAGHVTMLQRSPSYMFVLPQHDMVAIGLQKVLPAKRAHKIVRRKNLLSLHAIYSLARKRPELFKKLCRTMALRHLDAAYVDEHFTPTYEPWDQRLCLIPDADLYRVIANGSASVVTDHIDCFVPEGIRLRSGQVLEADVVVAATGLSLKPLGGLALEVDGDAVEVGDTVAYRAMMLSGVPNFGFCFGYANNSWTLRAELSARYLSRLLTHLDGTGAEIAVPTPPAGMVRGPFLDLTSGYVQRSMDQFPKSGDREPWIVSQNYLADARVARTADLTEDMAFCARERAEIPT